jgi:hypothetical protein
LIPDGVSPYPNETVRETGACPLAGLCREFGISRKTGYKIYKRYADAELTA